MVLGLGLFGIVVGFCSGFFGIGGGTVLVPALIYAGYDIKVAIGIAVVQMMMGSLFGSYLNHKHGKLELGHGLYLGVGALFGASFSGLIVTLLPRIALLSIFALILMMSIYKFFTAPIQPKSEPNRSKPLLFSIGLGIGLIAISVGTGGAVFLTPILVGFLSWEVKEAVATSLFFVIFGSISGFISLSAHGLVDYTDGFIVGVGSLVGVYFGVKQSYVVDKKIQKRLLLILYCVLFTLTVNKIFQS
ncbi:MAG: sulfite exporter TauE/SafE family protein [Sulfurospirillaceae bacterium]|nr:sulfite exporter TauE/SafE family protein [Sulfurospirillaceae bacterium]